MSQTNKLCYGKLVAEAEAETEAKRRCGYGYGHVTMPAPAPAPAPADKVRIGGSTGEKPMSTGRVSTKPPAAAQSDHSTAREALITEARSVAAAATCTTPSVTEALVQFETGEITNPVLEVSLVLAATPAQDVAGISSDTIATVYAEIKTAAERKPKVNHVVVRHH